MAGSDGDEIEDNINDTPKKRSRGRPSLGSAAGINVSDKTLTNDGTPRAKKRRENDLAMSPQAAAEHRAKAADRARKSQTLKKLRDSEGYKIADATLKQRMESQAVKELKAHRIAHGQHATTKEQSLADADDSLFFVFDGPSDSEEDDEEEIDESEGGSPKSDEETGYDADPTDSETPKQAGVMSSPSQGSASNLASSAHATKDAGELSESDLSELESSNGEGVREEKDVESDNAEVEDSVEGDSEDGASDVEEVEEGAEEHAALTEEETRDMVRHSTRESSSYNDYLSDDNLVKRLEHAQRQAERRFAKTGRLEDEQQVEDAKAEVKMFKDRLFGL